MPPKAENDFYVISRNILQSKLAGIGDAACITADGNIVYAGFCWRPAAMGAAGRFAVGRKSSTTITGIRNVVNLRGMASLLLYSARGSSLH